MVLQPSMPVHLDKALQQRASAARPPAGARTLELTCLGQVRKHLASVNAVQSSSWDAEEQMVQSYSHMSIDAC